MRVNSRTTSMMTAKTSGETKEQTTIASRRSQSKRRFDLFQQDLGLDSILFTFLVTSYVFSWYFSQIQSCNLTCCTTNGHEFEFSRSRSKASADNSFEEVPGSKSMRQLWKCLETEWGLKSGVVVFLVVFLKIHVSAFNHSKQFFSTFSSAWEILWNLSDYINLDSGW